MPIADDKLAFAERLKSALKRAPKKVQTAAQLAHEFNLRHPNEPVSPQGAAKWLKGTAKPSGDKMETLATWLNVTPHWLAYGPAPVVAKKPAAGKRGAQGFQPGQLSEKEAKLLSRFRALSEHQAFLVAEIVEQMAVEREVWSGDGG